jgi:hypothetical protein
LRVDVERHFEGIPRNEIKDIVSLKKPNLNKKTLEFVSKNSHNTKFHAHDLNDAKVLDDHIKDNLHIVENQLVSRTLPSDSGGKSNWL